MIDLHAHAVFEDTLGAAGRHGPTLESPSAETSGEFTVGDYRLVGVEYRGTAFMDVDVRLEQMNERRIDCAVLSPNPLTYFPRIEADAAIGFATAHNDAMARAIAAAPDRLLGLAQLPTQQPDAAVDELTRSVTTLGLAGAAICTDLDRPLDDPSLDPLYAACVDLDVPLFLHPSPPQAIGGFNDARLNRFDAELWLGFAYSETIAVSELVLGGVLSRHGALDVCVSHGGGATALLMDRMGHAASTRAWATSDVASPGAVADLLRRIWWDGHVGGPNALRILIDAFGSERVVAGTNFAGWDDVPGDWSSQPELDIFDTNARRLMRLDS